MAGIQNANILQHESRGIGGLRVDAGESHRGGFFRGLPIRWKHVLSRIPGIFGGLGDRKKDREAQRMIWQVLQRHLSILLRKIYSAAS